MTLTLLKIVRTRRGSTTSYANGYSHQCGRRRHHDGTPENLWQEKVCHRFNQLLYLPFFLASD